MKDKSEARYLACEATSASSHRTSAIEHLLLLCLCLLLVTSGCGPSVTANQMQYVLAPGRPLQSVTPSAERVLEVDRFAIEAAFAGKSFVYRVGEVQYETDYYNVFLAVPAVMITDETRNWLSRTGLFARVSGSTARTAPTDLLEGNVVELYGDLRDKKAPAAVMQIRFFLSHFASPGHPELVFSRDYSTQQPLESRSPAGLADAYSRCLQTILADLQKDLTEKLAAAH
jgi:cholesterol transport system auxiliary component